MLTQELVDRSRERAFYPVSTTFTDAKVLAEINTAQLGKVAPAIVKAMGEYFTETADLLPDSAGTVRLPYEALASTARVLTWVDANGQESGPIRRVEQGDIGSVSGQGGSGTIMVEQPDHTFVAVSSSSLNAGNARTSFALTPDGVQIFGYTSGGYVRCRYSRMPSLLLIPSSGAANTWTVATVVIAGGDHIATVAPFLGVGALPSAVYYDIVDNLAPHRKLATCLEDGAGRLILGAVGNAAADRLATRVRAGAYVCATGYTFVPQYSDEWHSLLMLYAAAALAGLRKDYTLEDRRLREAAILQAELINLAQPRTKQNPKVMSAWAGHTIRNRGLT